MSLNYPKTPSKAPLGSVRVSLLPLTFGLNINFLHPVNSNNIAKISDLPNDIPFHLINLNMPYPITFPPKYPTTINFLS